MRNVKFESGTYQKIVEHCALDSTFQKRLIKSTALVLREEGLDVPDNITLLDFVEEGARSFDELVFPGNSTLRDDELESPVACTNNSISRSGPWTNATNCHKSCGLC